MLTKMTEGDWVLVLEVFHACRSRCGDKGRDDRKFFEALHYFTVHNITWRALPAALHIKRMMDILQRAIVGPKIGPSSNQAASLESQPIHQIQLLFGRTFRDLSTCQASMSILVTAAN